MTPEIKASAQRIATDNDADVFAYHGLIDRDGYELVTDLCREQDPCKNAYVVLTTFGGDPHAAYRIARALRHNYAKLTLLIPRECKSAGTLLVIGASELVISDRGELGPLDVQLEKPNEIFETSSGLDVLKAVNVLQEMTLNHFRHLLVDIKMGTHASARMAGELATSLATSAFSPIYAQIDPMRLGEIQRALDIAFDYGQRLNSYDDNLRPGSLKKLQSSYPAHGFVIDRGEARLLFKNVRGPTDAEAEFGEGIYNLVKDDEGPTVLELARAPEAKKAANDEVAQQGDPVPNAVGVNGGGEVQPAAPRAA